MKSILFMAVLSITFIDVVRGMEKPCCHSSDAYCSAFGFEPCEDNTPKSTEKPCLIGDPSCGGIWPCPDGGFGPPCPAIIPKPDELPCPMPGNPNCGARWPCPDGSFGPPCPPQRRGQRTLGAIIPKPDEKPDPTKLKGWEGVGRIPGENCYAFPM